MGSSRKKAIRIAKEMSKEDLEAFDEKIKQMEEEHAKTKAKLENLLRGYSEKNLTISSLKEQIKTLEVENAGLKEAYFELKESTSDSKTEEKKEEKKASKKVAKQ